MTEDRSNGRWYWTPKQLARREDVHVYTVMRWMREGVMAAGRRVRLAARKTGGRWRIRPEDFEAFQTAASRRAAAEMPGRRNSSPAARAARHDRAKQRLREMGILPAA